MTRHEYRRWVKLFEENGGIVPSELALGGWDRIAEVTDAEKVDEALEILMAQTETLVRQQEAAVRRLIEFFGEDAPLLISVVQNQSPPDVLREGIRTSLYVRNPELAAMLGLDEGNHD